jgi:hypothetical protein
MADPCPQIGKGIADTALRRAIIADAISIERGCRLHRFADILRNTHLNRNRAACSEQIRSAGHGAFQCEQCDMVANLHHADHLAVRRFQRNIRYHKITSLFYCIKRKRIV